MICFVLFFSKQQRLCANSEMGGIGPQTGMSSSAFKSSAKISAGPGHGRSSIWCKVNTAFHNKNIIATVKHSNAGVRLLCCLRSTCHNCWNEEFCLLPEIPEGVSTQWSHYDRLVQYNSPCWILLLDYISGFWDKTCPFFSILQKGNNQVLLLCDQDKSWSNILHNYLNIFHTCIDSIWGPMSALFNPDLILLTPYYYLQIILISDYKRKKEIWELLVLRADDEIVPQKTRHLVIGQLQECVHPSLSI